MKKTSTKKRSSAKFPTVAIVMGSLTDYKVLTAAEEALKSFDISFETKVVSAHRTPQAMVQFAEDAESKGIKVIIAGAGGAAHLPGMIASLTALPVIGVPIETTSLNGLDALLSIAQMPKGVPVATVAVNNAFNAGLLAARILGAQNSSYLGKTRKLQSKQKKDVQAMNVKLKKLKSSKK